MALNYDFSKVKDHEKLHEDQGEWVKTDTLIWMCMSVGLSEITEENHIEFYSRLHFLELLNGSMAHADGKPYFFTVDDIKRRVGLKTNVSNTTRTQFVNTKTKRFFQEITQREGGAA